MRDLLQGVLILGAMTLAVIGLWRVNRWLYETTCRREVALGIVAYECRHYWDACEFYYGNCRNVDRTKPPRVHYKLVPVNEALTWTEVSDAGVE